MNIPFSLETSVEREKDAQHIDVHGKFEKLMVTLLVMRAFSNFPGASRGCAYFRDPTEVSRFSDNLAKACATALYTLTILLLCCLWLAPIASAEDYHGEFGVGRGYVFRGLEFNDGEVSSHGYLEVESETGLYAGLWMGTYDLEYDDSRDTEINYVLGFSRRIASHTSIDTAIVHYQYPGAEGRRNYDWTEWLTSVYLGSHWIIAYGLGENWLADSELTHSLELIYQYPMPLELNLDISAGKVIAENSSLGNYRYMGAGISRSIGPLGIRLAISTTNDQAKRYMGNSIAGTHSTIQVSWSF